MTQHDASLNNMIGQNSEFGNSDITVNKAVTIEQTAARTRGGPRRCGKCGELGHNTRTCPMTSDNR